ncbi:DUF2065 domain-containing protein [Hydrogenophaga sp.]|uniref:DUF2065 domain-containing protein n=1 Tax=Hydrogenophaga sp. TaxID=1904254 RepID=UPI0035AFD8E7
MSDAWWLALGLVLVFEGFLPLVSPRGWRHVFSQILQLQDGQIRFFGLMSVAFGLLVVWFFA